MNLESLLRILTQVIFLLVAGSTLINWARYRTRARRDIALVFLSLALAIVAQDLQGIFPALAPVLALIFFVALLMQPYLLLRLIRYFLPVSAFIQRASLIGLLVVFASFSLIQWAPLLIFSLAILYFFILEAYAALLLVKGARTFRGVVGRRLLLASIGSGLLALIFFLALALVLIRTAGNLPLATESWVGSLFQILAILSGLSYFLGFSPPRSIRQNWQFRELYRFLQQTSKRLEHNRFAVLEELAAAALRTVGGATASILGWNMAEKCLVIEIPGEFPWKAEDFETETGALGQAWQEKKPRLAHVPRDTGPGINQWASQFGARTLFIIPILGSVQPWGILIIALRYEPLFDPDDLELLRLLAAETASSLDKYALIDELQTANQSLEQRVAERTSQLEAEITERKQAAGQIRYQASLLQNVSDAVIATDPDFKITSWNRAAETLYGWSAADVIGKPSRNILQTEYLEAPEKETRDRLLQRGIWKGEVIHKHRDGTRINVLASVSMLKDEAGKVTGVVGVNRDITARKQAEERFRLAVESAPNAIILANPDGSIVMVNSQTEKFFGYSRMELVGLNVDTLVPERYRGIHTGHRRSFFADPQTRPMGVGRDLYGIRRDGSEFPVEIGLTPLETGEGLLVMATIVDITERKQAEERFHLAVEAAPNAIVLVQRDGRISLVNSQAEKFFGYDRDELTRLNVDSLVPERFRAQHAGYRTGFIADPQVRSMGVGRDLHGLRKDGSEFPVEIGLTPIETRDGRLIMATIVDITERKQAESKLRQQNQRLRALREIDTAILAADSVENIVGAALDHIRELIECRRASLTLIDRAANEAVTFDVRTSNATLVPKGTRMPLTPFQDIIQAVSKNQPVLITDLTTLKDPPPQTQSLIKEGLRSICILPLFSQKDLIGTFAMSSEIPGFFDDEKINLGHEVANQVAIAMTQSNLLNALRQLNAELEGRVAERTAQLSEANTLLQAMLDNIPDQIYFKDTHSRFIRNSRSQAELMGLDDPSEVMGRTDFDFFPHAQRAFDQEQALMRAGQPLIGLEEYVVWPDGQVMWVSTTKVPLRDREGQIIGIMGISRDITERKLFEENFQKLNEDLKQYAAQLRESEEKFSKAFLASPAAMSIALASDGRYIDVNEALARMTGYSREELLGHTSLELGLVDGEARAKILQAGKDLGSVRNVEIQVHTKSKQTLDVLVSLEQLILSGQACMLTIQYDITERKRAEAEVRRLNQELEDNRKDIQSILDSMSTLNAKVALDGRLLFVNKIATQASGLPVDELMKTSFLEGQWWAFDPKVQARVKEAFAQACSGIVINYDEKIFVFGRVITISFSLTPMLGSDGQVEYILAEGRDISNLKDAEESLRLKTAQLEAANQELESFSYSVSHDLRAPLRAISGFSQALSGKHADSLGEQGLHYLNRINANTRHMGELIDDLLSLSRISRREMKQDQVNLTELAREIVKELRAQEPERQVLFEVEGQLQARGDAGLVRIVLQNLLTNAWKFTSTRHEGGAHIQFGVLPPPQPFSGGRDGEQQPVYYVRDNGVGFDMAFANKLFGAFQRLHSTAEFPGTGIGLATVQRIIHRHGGRIWAEAELDKGATFYFTLGGHHEG